MQLNLLHTTIELLAEKAIFLPLQNTLVIADLHLGKAMHFRKSGIAVPQESAYRDYEKLQALIEKKQPEHIVIIGDLFHSRHNSEWELFCTLVNRHSKIKFTLVIGNHDILERSLYEKLCMEVIEDSLQISDLILSHEPMKKIPEGKINVAGHIHPGILLYGKGKQHIKLPCFYLRPQLLILPAFGNLTGLYLVEKEQDAEVFVIANDKVIHLPDL